VAHAQTEPRGCVGVTVARYSGVMWSSGRRGSGDFGYEAGGTLGTGGGQRSEDLPSSGALLGLVTTGDLACDHRGAQLAFSQVVSGINAIVIQKGKEMIAVFIESFAHGFFVSPTSRIRGAKNYFRDVSR
jgi:hypothetical protein